MTESYDPEIRERILKVLSDEPFSHLTEIARRAGTMRITASKHLERLKREGVVEEYKKGMLRLFVLKKGGV